MTRNKNANRLVFGDLHNNEAEAERDSNLLDAEPKCPSDEDRISSIDGDDNNDARGIQRDYGDGNNEHGM